MELSDSKKSVDSSVFSNIFVRTPLMIQRIVRIYEFVERFL